MVLSMFIMSAFINNIHSQVTIGAALPPAEGALLDLSPLETMTKGLGLPRVKLSDRNRLIIGGELIAPDADSPAQQAAHTGLLVYNVNEDICIEDPIYTALYVWDGKHWDGINTEENETLAPTVKILVDDRDPNNIESYLTGLFGKKRWMLENIRAKVWHPKRDNPEENVNTMQPLVGPYIMQQGKAAWAYPKERNSTDASDQETNNDSWYTARPDLGLLYNHNAASNYKYQDAKNKVYPQEGGNAGLQEVHQQGICPPGWHLPTDKEWTDLEIELIQNTPKYAYIAKPIAKHLKDMDGLTYENDASQRMKQSIGGKSEYGRGTLHGKVMRGRCESSKGLSRGAIKNGFVLTLAGHVYAAQRAYVNFYGIGGQAFLWTSSHDNRSFWGRGLYDGASTFVRSSFSEDYMFSVRCVQND